MNPRYLEELSWRMSEVYAATVDQILINLARHFKFYKETGVLPSGGWDYQIKKLAEMGQVNRETEQIILNMLGDADGTLRELLEVSILNGLKDAEPELRLAAKKSLFGSADNIPPVLDPSQMQAFQAYYKQSSDKLNLVNTVMLESTQNAYLSTVTDIATRIMNTQGILNVQTGQVVTGVTSINKAIRDGVKKMVNNGLTGFIDHGNHHWSPEAYVAMDVRTTMANTARAAVWERNEDYGNDLYQVSYHAGARPLCYDWQGKVISKSDTPRDVEDDEGNTVHVYAQSETTYGEPAGLFGINCGHYPIPFIPGFSRIRPPTQSKEENDKTYRESQQQRALERKLREEKRDLEVMKAQGASEAEIKAQKKRVREASDNINDFCQQTGRTRKRNRETAPIRAEFPEPGGTTVRYNGGYIPANAVPPPKGAFVPTPPTATPNVAPMIPTVTPTQNVNPQLTTPAPYVVQSKAVSEIATVTLPNSGIEAVPVTKWDHTPTFDEIVKSIGGADQTDGSCASVALAYAGNKGGYDVHDFRGGESRRFFGNKGNTTIIANLPGIDGKVITSASEISTANKLLKQMEDGHEYFLGVGRHASIVRKAQNGYEYLELQSATRNGWHELNDDILRWRFGALKRRNIALNARLIDVDNLANNDEFIEILKYINTAVDKQMKGVGGGIK